LKVNGSAKSAINQIHKRKYYHNLKDKGYKGNVLLVGINCNKNKEYSCIIEEYDSDLNLLSFSESINEKSKSENKRKKNTESEGIFKRLRSRKKLIK